LPYPGLFHLLNLLWHVVEQLELLEDELEERTDHRFERLFIKAEHLRKLFEVQEIKGVNYKAGHFHVFFLR